MDYFNYRDGQLYAEAVSLSALADQWGTPSYVYSRATLERHWRVFDEALAEHPHLICYAVKANSNLAVLNCFARLGSGFDIVSQGELMRVLAAGGDPGKIVFSGVGKTEQEIRYALQQGIYCFNVESSAELRRINTVAEQLQQKAPIALRINPDIDPETHPYIATGLREAKFGIPIKDALEVFQQAEQCSHLTVIGVDCHIGSQLTSLEPFSAALKAVLQLIDTLSKAGIVIQHLNMGGGLGVVYHKESPPSPADLATAFGDLLTGRDLKLIIEPGRAIAANAGVLLTKVEYLKLTPAKNFAIVDAAMNDLLRPALYDSWQEIIAVNQRSDLTDTLYDVVGPICETGDFLGKDRSLAIETGDLLAVRGAGAYSFSMSSNYNSRPRAAELMVDDDVIHCVRKRETHEDLFAKECILP